MDCRGNTADLLLIGRLRYEYGEHSAPGGCRGTWSSPSAGEQMR